MISFEEKLKIFDEHFEEWTIECEHPLEIRHTESNSFATNQAAKMIINILTDDFWKKY